jgi:hypothetical protein
MELKLAHKDESVESCTTGCEKPSRGLLRFVYKDTHSLTTEGFRTRMQFLQCLYYKPVSNPFCSGGGGRGSKIRLKR